MEHKPINDPAELSEQEMLLVSGGAAAKQTQGMSLTVDTKQAATPFGSTPPRIG